MISRVALRLIGVALLSWTSLAPAQSIVSLSKPIFQTGADFTGVLAARLLADGSMLVTDPGAREFVRVTARGSVRTVIGRRGAGPNEYELPRQLLTVGPGAYALIDPDQSRWMVFDSTGRFRQTKVFGTNEGFLSNAEFADSRGNVYGLGFSRVSSQSTKTPVLRWNSAGAKVDTAAIVSTGERLILEGPKDEKGRVTTVFSRFVPYAAADAYAVLPKGEIAIARAATERIEWFDAFGRTIGSTPMPQVPRVPVSDSVRAAEPIAKMRDRIPKTRPLWADNVLNVSPDGFVWMRRTRAPPEDFTEFLEFSRIGGVSRRLRVPGRVWIVGAAGGRIILARRTEDELQQLEVYALPKRAVSASK